MMKQKIISEKTKLIKKKNLNESYENQSVEFRFDGRDEDPALEMALTQPTHGTIGVRGIGKVNSNCSYAASLLQSLLTTLISYHLL